MQIESVPNKYKMLQTYYLEVNNEIISYDDALHLFYELDEETRLNFEQFYKDETGYEIIDANGYNLDDFHDGPSKADIMIKYNLEAYAKKSGKILDPQWTGFSAEEIIAMYQNGVVIPQDVVDIANSIIQAQSANLLTNSDETNDSDTTEKEPYLELLPKAAKKIEACKKNNEKLTQEINEILPEQKKQEKNLKENMDNQKKALKEYANTVREWQTLQDKIKNGDVLTDSENKKYKELSLVLENNKLDKDNFEIDKKEIAKSLNDINILAVLGDKLADETIEISETLSDYTSEANYKATNKTVAQGIGFIQAILAMAKGKALAEETSKIGNSTKGFTEQTKTSVNNIASTLDIKTTSENIETEDENGVQTETAVTTFEAKPQEEDKQKENVPNEELKAIITDAFVQTLIAEGRTINSNLEEQIAIATEQMVVANKDGKIAQDLDKTISKLVTEFVKKEDERQKEITKKEDENENAKQEIGKLTGKSSQEVEKDITSEKTNANNDELKPETNKEINKQNKIISKNNVDIQKIQEESVQAREIFKQKTVKEKSTIDNTLPVENNALKINTKFQEQQLPVQNERMNFINYAGTQLIGIGSNEVILGGYQIQLGQSLLSSVFTWPEGIALIAQGTATVAKGTNSIEIGSTAVSVSDDESLIEKADQKASTAGIKIGSTVKSFKELNNQIVSITKEDQNNNSNQEVNNSNNNQNNNSNIKKQNTQNSTNSDITNSTVTSITKTSNPTQNDVTEVTINDINNSSQQPKIVSNEKTANTPETKDKEEEKKIVKNAANEANSPNSSKSSEKKEKELTTDDAQSDVNSIAKSANNSAKDSEKVQKDTDKSTKKLTKEAKRLEKQMKKDEKNIIKMAKASERAAKKQEVLFAEYETLNTHTNQLILEDENKQSQVNDLNENNSILDSNTMSNLGAIAESSNSTEIQNNDQRLNEIGTDFQVQGNLINRNRTKMVKLQKRTKINSKKFNKKTKIINKKGEAAEKKEQDKQKKLNRQLGVVGVAENLFSITLSTGLILKMSAWPATVAVGVAMTKVGTYGIATCGATKGIINLANGNLTGALMSIGQSAISVATSMTGTGAAAGGVLGSVSAGLNIVSSSAELVNNVRAAQGKEANSIFSKMATITGVASSITSATSTLKGLENTSSSFGKLAKISSVVGTGLSSTSQLMTEFGEESKFANALGMLGGAISTAASVGLLVDARNNKIKNNETKDSNETKENNETKDTKDTKDANGNKETKDTKGNNQTKEKVQKEIEKQALKEAKEVIKEQKELSAGLDGEARDNMVENGASKEFANIGDDELQERIEYSLEIDDKDTANKLLAEWEQRGEYKTKLGLIDANKAVVKENISKIMHTISDTAKTAMSTFNMSGNNNNQQQRKKTAPPGELTKKAKEIIKKHKKRVQALAYKF